MASAEEIAWAAGLFEGEGTITHARRRSPGLLVAVTMTDEDVVRRFDEVVDRGKVYGPYSPPSYRDRWKPFWRWQATGDAAHDVLDLIGPWLSPRRIAQARMRGVLIPAEVAADPSTWKRLPGALED